MIATLLITLLMVQDAPPTEAAHRDAPILIQNDQIIALTSSVFVSSNDAATGNCWTNASAVESRARYLLELADIPVRAEHGWNLIADPSLEIYVQAERTSNDLCYGSLSIRVLAQTGTILNEHNAFFVREEPIWVKTWTAVHSTNFNEFALDVTEQGVQDFVTSRLRYRRELEEGGVILDPE